ncbi:MAG: hypothetical protein PHD54_15665 [Desulfuromonadaceae bacterium]|nr:hypothetical protein [Desulfuromonadaceae bacterium]
MSVSEVSSGIAAVVYTPPVQQQAKAQQKAPSADIVSISKQAQLLANDGDTQAQEVREGAAEKAGESLRGKA